MSHRKQKPTNNPQTKNTNHQSIPSKANEETKTNEKNHNHVIAQKPPQIQFKVPFLNSNALQTNTPNHHHSPMNPSPSPSSSSCLTKPSRSAFIATKITVDATTSISADESQSYYHSLNPPQSPSASFSFSNSNMVSALSEIHENHSEPEDIANHTRNLNNNYAVEAASTISSINSTQNLSANSSISPNLNISVPNHANIHTNHHITPTVNTNSNSHNVSNQSKHIRPHSSPNIKANIERLQQFQPGLSTTEMTPTPSPHAHPHVTFTPSGVPHMKLDDLDNRFNYPINHNMNMAINVNRSQGNLQGGKVPRYRTRAHKTHINNNNNNSPNDNNNSNNNTMRRTKFRSSHSLQSNDLHAPAQLARVGMHPYRTYSDNVHMVEHLSQQAPPTHSSPYAHNNNTAQHIFNADLLQLKMGNPAHLTSVQSNGSHISMETENSMSHSFVSHSRDTIEYHQNYRDDDQKSPYIMPANMVGQQYGMYAMHTASTMSQLSHKNKEKLKNIKIIKPTASTPVKSPHNPHLNNNLTWKTYIGNFVFNEHERGHKLYQKFHKIGAGVFARVYRTVRKDPQRPVALKVFPKKNKFAEGSFANELMLLHNVSHPNIVALYDAHVDPKYFYLEMEVCSGGDIFKHISTMGCLSEGNVRQIMFNILDAIRCFHESNFVHRDLKPENIVFASTDSLTDIRLIDFGETLQIDMNGSYDEFVGTPCYFSPERFRCHTGLELKKSDVWAIGVIMFEMLTAMRCFKGGDDKQLLRKNIENKHMTWPQDTTVSKVALDLFDKLVEVDPVKRYSCQEALNHPWLSGLRLNKNETNKPRLQPLVQENNSMAPAGSVRQMQAIVIKTSKSMSNLKSVQNDFNKQWAQIRARKIEQMNRENDNNDQTSDSNNNNGQDDDDDDEDDGKSPLPRIARKKSSSMDQAALKQTLRPMRLSLPVSVSNKSHERSNAHHHNHHNHHNHHHNHRHYQHRTRTSDSSVSSNGSDVNSNNGNYGNSHSPIISNSPIGMTSPSHLKMRHSAAMSRSMSNNNNKLPQNHSKSNSTPQITVSPAIFQTKKSFPMTILEDHDSINTDDDPNASIDNYSDDKTIGIFTNYGSKSNSGFSQSISYSGNHKKKQSDSFSFISQSHDLNYCDDEGKNNMNMNMNVNINSNNNNNSSNVKSSKVTITFANGPTFNV